MVQKEPCNCTVEDYDFDSFVGLNRKNHFSELQNEFRTHEVQRRIVKCNSPIGWRNSIQANLGGIHANSGSIPTKCFRSIVPTSREHDWTMVLALIPSSNGCRVSLML